MPAERLSMRKVREVLRLKYACGASERVIARSVGIGRTAIGEYSEPTFATVSKLASAGHHWQCARKVRSHAWKAYGGMVIEAGGRAAENIASTPPA